MEGGNLTPEDKLLKIIETPALEKKRQFGSPPPEKKIDYLIKIKSWANAYWKEKKFLKLLELKNITKGIIGICAVLAVFFVFDFICGRSQAKDNFLRILQPKAAGADTASAGPALEVDWKQSINLAKKRNMFTFTPKEEKPEVSEEDLVKQSLDKAIVDLSLVGIIWSETNPQAIIEDAKKEKTYLLNEGDQVELFHVEDIRADSVTLKKDEGEWVLR